MFDEKHVVYLAGIMDGEGTFYIGQEIRHPKCFNSRLYVVNTDERLIQWLHNIFGGLVYSRSSKTHPRWKEKFEWITNKNQILPICEAILPYLICKKEQAKILIAFRKTFDQKRGRSNPVPDELHQFRLKLLSDLRELNHRTISN